MDLQRDGALYSLMRLQGEEAVIYEIFNHLPLAQAAVALFVFVTFLSYVTAADSNTEAISHLCTEGARHNLHSQVAASVKLKLIWGVSIGTVAWIMVSFAKIDGITSGFRTRSKHPVEKRPRVRPKVCWRLVFY